MTERTLTPDHTAMLIVDELLATRAGERVALVCDQSSEPEMTSAFVAHLTQRGLDYITLVQPDRPAERKNELDPAIARALEAVDVMIALTMTSGAPIYGRVVRDLVSAKRLRFMSMVMRDMDIFTRGGATADYRILKAEGERLAALWSQGREMHITSAGGTDIRAPIAHDDVLIECGYATQPGTSAAFSDGEVSSRPLQGTAEGRFVIDGPGALIGRPERPITVSVTEGRVSAIDGQGKAADTLRHLVDTVENAGNIAEFGIGLNPACRANGKFEEEKKRRGQVHIAIGDNIAFGGDIESAVHLDLVVCDPTVSLDGRIIVDQGKVRLED